MTNEICDIIYSASQDHERAEDFKNKEFRPSYRWDGVILDVFDDHFLAKAYDSKENVFSEVEIPVSNLNQFQINNLSKGVLFYLFSGLFVKTGKTGFKVEYKRVKKSKTIDDIINSFEKYNIEDNFINLPKF